MFLFISGMIPKITRQQTSEAVYCFNCHNTLRWTLIKEVSWISLFFVPIIPLRTRYYAQCPICSATHSISKESFERQTLVF